ncbi:MAG: tetratricopeptide repeat protein [Anaerolineae bacterium]|nr:tetratricopeptide repeat protein [Anaerolineae bacterium]
MTHLAIYLLGGLQVILEGEPVTDFATDKARALLAYLAVEAERPHRRDVLAGLLWPEQTQAKARHNVRQTLSYLRQALGEGGDVDVFLLVSRETVQFNPNCSYWLDITAFKDLVRTCQTHRHRRLTTCPACLERMEQMDGLYCGEFLAGFSLDDSSTFEEWVSLEREWLHREMIDALAHLANYYERCGDFKKARHYAWRQVALEPWREEAYRQLMRLLALDGQRSAALVQYETCRRILAEELGVEPTAETVMLYQSIRAEARTDERAGAFSSLLSGSPACLYHLPPQPTPFVGRQEELAELTDCLANPDCRLLTIVGPGGVGKTRLALQAAARQRGMFTHGVCFVPFVSVSSVELMATTIADVLNLSFDSQKNQEKQLLDYLGQKEMLLVLDNLEHLLAGGKLLSKLLQSAPGVVLLVTSRERLNLQEEWVYEIGGLTYPRDPMRLVSENYSAVELFVQGASRVQRRFTLTEQVQSAVGRICRAVEGLPLGVEMAAAWVTVSSCAEIADEIERNLDMLATSWRNVPQRHRSVRATFEYSWNLLSGPEQMVFCRLSVFRGGFQAEAAKVVANASRSQLLALVDKSLLRCESSDRYQIHELLRQCAMEKLRENPQELAETQQRHADYYATFLQQQKQALKGAGMNNALRDIGVEIDNVRHTWNQAITWLEHGQNEATAINILQRSLEGLYLFYQGRDWYQEGEGMFSRVATILADMAQPSPEVELLWGRLLACQGKCCEITAHSDKAQQLFDQSLKIFYRLGTRHETALPLHGLGYMAHIKGQYTQARQYLQESLGIYQELDDVWSVANVLGILCLVARRQGRFAEAQQHAEESLVLRRKIGNQRGIAACLNRLGLIYCDLGAYHEAKQVLQEALDVCRRFDFKIEIANALTGLCQVAFRLGEIELAEQFGQECLVIYQDIGDQWGRAIALNNLGRMAFELENHLKAKQLYQESITIYRQIGIKSGLLNTLGNLGEVCYELGEHAQARQHLREALQIACNTDAIPAALKSLVCLVPLLVQEGKTMQSLELLAFVMAHPANIHDIQAQAVSLFAKLSADLSSEEIVAVQTRGKTRQLDAVAAEILRNQ